MSNIGAPKTKQSSRKGRKAWRKNVDVSDIQKGLEEQAEELIQHGGNISDAENENLFFIDEDADESIEKNLKKNNVKKLKASEILENKSKVKPMYKQDKVTKSKKVQGVSKADMHKLLKLAGKVKGYDKHEERLSEEGIIKSKAFDVWETLTSEEKRFAELPEPLKEKSASSFTASNKIPRTMREGPIKVKHIEVIPHAGKSYNPTYENWKDLIDSAFFKEKTVEDKRIELEEFQMRLKYIMDNEHHSEVESSDDDEEEEDEEAKEAEEGEEDLEKYKLSINPATQRKIKTKTRRNRDQRRREERAIREQIQELEAYLKHLESAPEVLEEVIQKEKERAEKPFESKGDRKLRRGTRKMGKFEVIEGPLEVKLSNELSDSLRKLKPEGNLLYDQMKRMQSKGIIETRRGRQGKKKKTKNTEKWSYKDFK